MRKEEYKKQLNILVKAETRRRLQRLAEEMSTEKNRVSQTELVEKWINQAYRRRFKVKK